MILTYVIVGKDEENWQRRSPATGGTGDVVPVVGNPEYSLYKECGVKWFVFHVFYGL